LAANASPAALMSATITLPPSATIISAVAPPRPDPPPVTMKVLLRMSMPVPVSSEKSEV
jgi:hypothetical protein